jgi:hypothetical protein
VGVRSAAGRDAGPGGSGASRRPRGALLVVLTGLLGLLATACAGTVAGNGKVAADAARPAGRGSATPSASASGGSSGGRKTLSCSGKTVAPAGAPYCFTIPDGFQDVSSSVTFDTSIGNEKYRSAVAVGDRDLIIVTVYELRVDTDPIAADTLEGELKTVLAQLSRQGFTFDSTVARRGTVDGARSFGYHARQPKNMLESDVYFLFRGTNEIEVNCQWKNKEAEVGKGCRSVLQSLQVKSK